MSNPFSEAEDEIPCEILEGFLCPICREDLKSLEFLTEHFERSHSDEEDAVKSIIKTIFSKAKRKIKLNFEDSADLTRNLEKNANSSGENRNNGSQGLCQRNTNPYEILKLEQVGAERGHFDYFQSVRNPRLERYASETNKLIIRLHKLLKDMPTDPILKKNHEQKTVHWLDGSSVKLCPSCARSFHLTRRQHHCRLCGSILCNDCSRYLPIDMALDLASLTMSCTESTPPMQGNAVTSQQSGIRTCGHCLWLVEARKEMHESRTCRPPITRIYAELQQMRKDVIPDTEMYVKIIDSLYDGESIYTIADASALRGKIGQIAEAMEGRSKAILTIHTEAGSREEALKKAIRFSSIQFIKDNMLSIPTLPAEDEIYKIQERKRMEAEQRIETERRQALEAYERYGLMGPTPIDSDMSMGKAYAQGSYLHTLDNWSAHQVSVAGISLHDDPLIEQINIVKSYIKQARQEMNFEVVETLELNLAELQREFYERQREPTSADNQK